MTKLKTISKRITYERCSSAVIASEVIKLTGLLKSTQMEVNKNLKKIILGSVLT